MGGELRVMSCGWCECVLSVAHGGIEFDCQRGEREREAERTGERGELCTASLRCSCYLRAEQLA